MTRRTQAVLVTTEKVRTANAYQRGLLEEARGLEGLAVRTPAQARRSRELLKLLLREGLVREVEDQNAETKTQDGETTQG